MEKEWIDLTATQWLGSKPSLYSVDSEVIPRLHYAAKGDELMVLRDHQIYRMGLHEAAEWIRRCIVPEMAEEMQEVVTDMINNKRGELTFGSGLCKWNKEDGHGKRKKKAHQNSRF